jgi:hypothetical protein
MFMKFQVWVHDSEGNTTEQICDNSGEDPKCCRFDGSYLPGSSNVVSLSFCCNISFLICGVRCISMFSLSIQDHFTYLGVDMEADDWSTCRIIGAQSIKKFYKELTSNIIMAKHNVDVSIVEPSKQRDLSSFR